jgi:hypothetical protein
MPEDQGGAVARSDEREEGSEPEPRFVATRSAIGHDDVGLLGWVALGAVQKTKEEGTRIGGEAAATGGRRGDDFHVAPTEAKKLAAPDPGEPKKELGDVGKEEAQTDMAGSSRVSKTVTSVSRVPQHMCIVDGHGGSRLRAQTALHTGDSELSENMRGRATAQKFALDGTVKGGAVDALLGFKNALPSVGSIRSGAEAPGAWETHEILILAGGGTSSVLFQTPAELDGRPVGGERRADIEPITR